MCAEIRGESGENENRGHGILLRLELWRFHVHAGAKVDRRLVDGLLCGLDPQVKVIALGLAMEAAKHISFEVG
jgi:hypothetical protein